MVDINEKGGEKYIYHSLQSETMDKIQKRKGYIRTFTAICLVTVISAFLFYKERGIEDNLITNSVKEKPYNFTAGQNSENFSKFRSFVYISTLFSLWFVVFAVANFLHRVCLLMEELYHRKTRYNGSYKKLLISVFGGSWNLEYFIGVIFVIGFVGFSDHAVALYALQSNFNMLTAAVTILLLWFTVKRWSDTEFEHSASCAPCLGIAMAYGIYYSYYEHVLDGLKQRIEVAEKCHGIIIPLKKLLLLFPSSGVYPNQLDDGNDDMTKVGELPAVEVDRGGTMNRKMTNPIYKVFLKHAQPLYCVTEGINCLSTLKAMNLSEEVFVQQAHLLYITLKQILDGSPYKNSYTILCYDDENDCERLSTHLWAKHEELLNKVEVNRSQNSRGIL